MFFRSRWENRLRKRNQFLSGIAFVLLLFALLLSGCGGSQIVTINTTPLPEEAYDNVLSAEKIRADAMELVQIVEETHPAFIEQPHEDYASAKAAFLEATTQEMTLEQFHICVSFYLASLHDGHTSVLRAAPKSLDLRLSWDEEGLTVFSGENLPRGAKIESIAGIPVETLQEVIDAIAPYENEVGLWHNRSNYATRQFVHIAAGAAKAETAKVIYQYNGETGEAICAYLAPVTQTGQRPKSFEFMLLEEDEGDVALITTRRCEMGADLNKVAQELATALGKGVTKIIFDLRDNPGGNSVVWDSFYKVMSMERNRLGSLRRISTLAKQQIPDYRNMSGVQEYEPSNQFKDNDDLDLIVLVNGATFSSAMHFVAQVHDAGVATIIGSEPRNMASHYGYLLSYRLTNSGFVGRISHVKWIRPDPSLDETNPEVVDIAVDEGKDALTVALAEFRK